MYPELLAPAGSPERLDTALTYGADAVYLGGTDLNLRAQTPGFSPAELNQALHTAHAQNRRIYYCLNILPHPEQIPLVQEQLQGLEGTSVDALIAADPGVIRLARKILPRIPIHISTQANTSNPHAAAFWQDQGASRVNLARELDLRAVRAIRRAVPDLELESFVHGAMCMAISGRCHMSAHLTRRSANQGLCTQPCRFKYRSVFLEEAQRTGEPTWEALEDEAFTTLLASEDLALIDFLPWLSKAGMDSLKIEGRMKTSSYLAQVVDIYATALADIRRKTFRPGLYWRELQLVATRPLCTGFFLPGRRKRLFTPERTQPRAPVLAKILCRDGPDTWRISLRHRWESGRKVQILVPGLRRPELSPAVYSLESLTGDPADALHSGQEGLLRSDHPDLRPGLMLRAYPEQSPEDDRE
ncbi:peptidase U32 family protein [Desulfovermiculus halophilus]|jgi:putative protease|uniref:peptidase U32 family protein n=1 Tax=Desulfovermiculus halophilus TaxID=339722 RepID=UPI00054FADD3|nr:peptidase U32 family protein [Desulfovermiculus halophilus]